MKLSNVVYLPSGLFVNQFTLNTKGMPTLLPRYLKSPVKPESWNPNIPTVQKAIQNRFTHLTSSGKAGDLKFDKLGRPINPKRSSVQMNVDGRGKFWFWGPNQAADPVVLIDKNGDRQDITGILIRRMDSIDRGIVDDEWAIPGGFVDVTQGELPQTGALREFAEEVFGTDENLEAFLEDNIIDKDYYGKEIYKGINIKDPRNTRNAWAETNVYLWVLDGRRTHNGKSLYEFLESTIKPRDDAIGVQMIPLRVKGKDQLDNYLFYSSHRDYLTYALDKYR